MSLIWQRNHPNLTKSEVSVHSKDRFPMQKGACIGGSVTLLIALLVVTSGCGSFLAPTPPPPTAEAYCASSFASIGYGNFFYCGTVQANLEIVSPRWTAQNRPLIDSSKPATTGVAAETMEFYFVASSVRKSVWTFVRQLRGPHLSTCA